MLQINHSFAVLGIELSDHFEIQFLDCLVDFPIAWWVWKISLFPLFPNQIKHLLRRFSNFLKRNSWLGMMKNNSRYHRIVEERLLLQLVKSELLRELKREVLERAALMLVQISV